jgi:large subunit ribosomal protein L15
VNLDTLGSLFPDAGEVGIADLIAKGAVRGGQPVKVLGNGELGVALRVSANAFSKTAKEKIEAAGGSVTEV